MGEDAVQAEKSSAESRKSEIPESQDLVVPSPSPAQSPTPSLNLNPLAAESIRDSSQVNAITVLTLLDKLVNMLDTVQENQHKMEQHQADIENTVKGIQNDITKLSKSHTSTSNTVSKLLEKSRKVSVNMKEVRERMDKQAVQVKKLETNHAQLLKRNNFKVLIFQEENEIPASVFMKDPALPSPKEGEDEHVDENKTLEETLHTVDLSSDEDVVHEDDIMEEILDEEKLEQSRAEKIKRSSLKKVDSLKKAFSRQNIEKKMNKISTKIVSPERREKIRKSLSPNHQKVSGTKSSSFKVSPITFNVKKVREGEVPVQSTEESVVAVEAKPSEDTSFSEEHSEVSPTSITEEIKAAADSLEKEIKIEGSPITDNSAELTTTEGIREAEITLEVSSHGFFEEEPNPATEETKQPTEESGHLGVFQLDQTA
ncbi:caveolae-associated protein 2 [Latimeria chalumnae]|uniref:Caveolae associated protein 2 n=1 Tax=Latimeria chalumnae TaxID=7897 RepID=H3A9X1_LATCH|nr:PREDICTED: serum deprivation-response protein [Latimeria chalumnae]|eukprot:XP_005997304.1 PREDICTED: serum deprivation-response protein [Latimeria chalumnae]